MIFADIISSTLSTQEIDYRFIRNAENSGNVFRQWKRGVELAAGDFVWIAEADDLAEAGFLEQVMSPFKDPDVVMSYCESNQMGENGERLAGSYRDYVADISATKWNTAYVEDGQREIRDCLAIKNTIPNVSAVVFRRDALRHVLAEHLDEISAYRIAGDWVTYTNLLERGKIAFSPRALNHHRRHEASVTLSSMDIRQLKEIVRVQKMIEERFELDTDVSTMAAAYAQRLYEQFGLVTEDCPQLKSNPEFAT